MSRSPSPNRDGLPAPRERGSASTSGETKLFVANLTFQTQEKDLDELFRKFGRIKETRVAVDNHTGRSKGFAFITMEDARDADEACKSINGTELDGRNIKVEIANGRTSTTGGRSSNSRFNDACHDFARGRCTRGDSCRFSHREGGDDNRGDRDRGGDRGGRDRYDDRDRDRDRRDDRGGRDRDRDRDGGRRDRDRDDRDRRDRSRDRY